MARDTDTSNAPVLEATSDSGVNVVLERIEALLDHEPWKVSDAKSQLTHVLRAARRGAPALIGLDDPVVVISRDTLVELVRSAQRARSWADVVAPDDVLPLETPLLPTFREHPAASSLLPTSIEPAE